VCSTISGLSSWPRCACRILFTVHGDRSSDHANDLTLRHRNAVQSVVLPTVDDRFVPMTSSIHVKGWRGSSAS
jgi:hypothetical protein